MTCRENYAVSGDNREAEREAELTGGIGRRSAAVRAVKWGNRPEGPCGAKGGAGPRNRWRER